MRAAMMSNVAGTASLRTLAFSAVDDWRSESIAESPEVTEMHQRSHREGDLALVPQDCGLTGGVRPGRHKPSKPSPG